jgi:hypothetical protein
LQTAALLRAVEQLQEYLACCEATERRSILWRDASSFRKSAAAIVRFLVRCRIQLLLFERRQMGVQYVHLLQLTASCSTDTPPRTGSRSHRVHHIRHIRQPTRRRNAGSRGFQRGEHGSHQRAHGPRPRRSERRRCDRHQSGLHQSDRRQSGLRQSDRRRVRHHRDRLHREQRTWSGLQNQPERERRRGTVLFAASKSPSQWCFERFTLQAHFFRHRPDVQDNARRQVTTCTMRKSSASASGTTNFGVRSGSSRGYRRSISHRSEMLSGRLLAAAVAGQSAGFGNPVAGRNDRPRSNNQASRSI